MLLVQQLRLPLEHKPGDAEAAARRRLRISAGQIASQHIHKVSVDARHGSPHFVYTVAISLRDAAAESRYEKMSGVRFVPPLTFARPHGAGRLPGPVIVCGLGPAGLFAALELAEAGFAPLVLERGPEMAQRREAVTAFEAGGALLPDANIQFGEGGAGAFSDGKLTTRISDPLCSRVIQRLLAAGAPAEIGYTAKPHIGTDLLRDVFVSLRKKLVAMGGRVLFNTKLTGLSRQQGQITSVQTTQGDFPCGALVLAVGHSARDTFRALLDSGVPLQAKPFSVGVRIEHRQSEIDKGLYHGAAGHPALPPGEYQLSARENGRGVYTFCMCPGGSVVAAASEEGGVVTNGMSLHARDGKNANAALVVSVDEKDFGPGVLDGIAFQQSLEHNAFAAVGRDYTAPAQTVGSFLRDTGELQLGAVQPTYPRGVRAAALSALLPPAVTPAMQNALRAFGRKLPGFDAPDAVLTGLETRTSSPVRILRGDDFTSDVRGLYPCGEGAGYAGGIMSAAVDGMKTALAIMAAYKAPS